MPSVGIDLGTTNSCVAVLDDGQVEILTNKYGSRITPSFVAFSKNSILIGEGAKLQQKDNPSNTIFGVKRLIGRDCCDKTVKQDQKAWHFKVVDDHGRPKIQLSPEEGSKVLPPELISAIVLKKMKDIASERIGEVLPRAVIAVPAYFNGAQRNATIDAARVADLEVLAVINEPTAAALAYGIQRQMKSKRTVLVYDLGGGTFDVTLLTIHGANFEVIATGGDTHLGGDDFIQAMVQHLAAEFQRKEGMNVKLSKRAMIRLRVQCELTIKNLSVETVSSDMISLDALADGKDFSYKFTRATFEKLNHKAFQRTLDVITSVLSDADTTLEEVDDVLLVGGSSRIPYVQNALKNLFGEKIRQGINPDEAVAYGAAVYAAYLSNETVQNVDSITIQDVAPLSLGTDVTGGKTSFLIRRNTRIPATRRETFFTATDYQTEVHVGVYEGESDKFEENHWLGGFTLGGIPSMKAGEAEVVVEFSVNENGVLNVSAYETTEKNQRSIVVKSDQRRFTEKQINDTKQMLRDFVRMSEEAQERNTKLNELEELVNELQRSHLSDSVRLKCGVVDNWIKDNEEADLTELSQKLEDLKAFSASLTK